MKELSVEEKAKHYDEAIERAKKWYNAPNVDKIPTFGNRVIEDIFPELKESEDEMIRKYLINQYKGDGCLCGNNFRISYEDIRAWLERQVQKPVAWSEEDKKMLKWVIGYLENKMLNTPISEERTACKNAIAWLKEEVQPQTKQEWSEEDERMCKAIIDNIKVICEEGYFVGNIDSNKLIDWLKSLRHRLQWKPSAEQIKALETTLYTNMSRNDERYSILSKFVTELKKLKSYESKVQRS